MERQFLFLAKEASTTHQRTRMFLGNYSTPRKKQPSMYQANIPENVFF